MNNADILFISLSNIGDTILTTPVLESLHAIYPEAKIDIVSDNRSRIIYQHCPYRREIIIKNKQGLLRGGISLAKKLRQHEYELVVDLRTDGFAFLLRGKTKLTKRKAIPYGVHAVEEHMGVIRRINGNKGIPATKTWITDDHINFAESQIGEFCNKRLLVIAPGCHVPVKVWPTQNYRDMSNQLASDFDAVILLGAAEDKSYAQQIGSDLSIPCKDLTGQTDLLQAAAVLRFAKLFVGNDSGLGHIASTANIPTLTLFGIGNPERYRPWGTQSWWLQGKNKDINNIKVADVVSVVKNRLGTS